MDGGEGRSLSQEHSVRLSQSLSQDAVSEADKYSAFRPRPGQSRGWIRVRIRAKICRFLGALEAIVKIHGDVKMGVGKEMGFAKEWS